MVIIQPKAFTTELKLAYVRKMTIDIHNNYYTVIKNSIFFSLNVPNCFKFMQLLIDITIQPLHTKHNNYMYHVMTFSLT